jgi:uncharacterized protein (DUF2141 family)
MKRFNSLLLAVFGMQIIAAGAADLTIDITGVEKPHGKVVVSIYKSSESFLKAPVSRLSVGASTPGVSVVMRSLEPGEYALSAYQDENDNGLLDTNMLGVPTEHAGASNNAREKFGPPKFEQAKFSVERADMTASFQLHR